MNLVENEQKFLQFYDQNIAKIYRYIYFRVGSEELAQDLAAEAFTKAWQYIKEGNYIGNLSAMIYQICRNLIADNFRKKQNALVPLDQVLESHDSISDKDVAKLVDDNLSLDRIRAGMTLIKEEYREIIVWHYIEDFEIMEMAEILGKSEGSIRTALSRALRALKEVLEK